jgi:hypothetical protein
MGNWERGLLAGLVVVVIGVLLLKMLVEGYELGVESVVDHCREYGAWTGDDIRLTCTEAPK